MQKILILNRIISVRWKFLKLFNYMQANWLWLFENVIYKLYIYKFVLTGSGIKKATRVDTYYVHFRANTFVKGMNPLILPAMG